MLMHINKVYIYNDIQANFHKQFCVSIIFFIIYQNIELVFFHFIIMKQGYHTTLSASTYFQCGPFYWVVVHISSPPLTGEQYGKMEPKYSEGGHWQIVLRPQGAFNVPLYFL